MQRYPAVLTLALLASGCASLTDSSAAQVYEHTYVAEWIGERPLIDSSHLSFALERQGRAHGMAGCNQWFADYQLDGHRLHLDKIATTRKLCAPALMEQEQRYLEALSQIQRWDFSTHGQLQLWPEHGAPIRLWPESTAATRP